MVRSKELLNAEMQETIAFLFSKDRVVEKKPQSKPTNAFLSVGLFLFLP